MFDELRRNIKKSAAVPPNRRYAGERAFASVCTLTELITVKKHVKIKHH